MFGNNPYNFNTTPTATQPYGYPINPYMTGIPQQQQQQTLINTNKIYVTGIEDVRNRMIPAGSDYVFLDNDKPLLYQKIVDSKGQFDVKVFDIIPHVEAPIEESVPKYVSNSDFETLQKKVTELENTLTKITSANNQTKEVIVSGTTATTE